MFLSISGKSTADPKSKSIESSDESSNNSLFPQHDDDTLADFDKSLGNSTEDDEQKTTTVERSAEPTKLPKISELTEEASTARISFQSNAVG